MRSLQCADVKPRTDHMAVVSYARYRERSRLLGAGPLAGGWVGQNGSCPELGKGDGRTGRAMIRSKSSKSKVCVRIMARLIETASLGM
jgi:hypothetical protein